MAAIRNEKVDFLTGAKQIFDQPMQPFQYRLIIAGRQSKPQDQQSSETDAQRSENRKDLSLRIGAEHGPNRDFRIISRSSKNWEPP
jgi:hypothetical protein